MFRFSRLLVVLGTAFLLAAISTAEARRGSVLINQPETRKEMTALVKGSSLQLTERLVGSTAGVSSYAVRKAAQTERGFNGFNYKAGAKSYVVSSQRRKLVVTTARIDATGAAPAKPREYFVARDGKSGVVVGRGYVTDFGIVWTRSKNERGKDSPSERNAAGR